MYNEYLSVFATVISVIGTIVAILSILKMGLKDVIYERTVIGTDTRELSSLRQVYDARVGTVLLVISGVVQIIAELFNKITCCEFWIVLGVTGGICISWWISMYLVYRKGRKRLLDDMPDEIKKHLNKNQ